jgi:hypothetical protein
MYGGMFVCMHGDERGTKRTGERYDDMKAVKTQKWE